MDKLILSKAIEALLKGEVIVYPTDTLYGLGADVFNDVAVRKVYEIKKRSMSNPLSVAVSGFNELEKVAFVDDRTRLLVGSFLPGKLTLVLNKKDTVSDIVTGDLDKVAIRIPDNKVALELLSQFGPITATSANIHGKKTSFVINDIIMQFKDDVAVYLDDGKLNGKPSTIVDMTSKEVRVIREGDITKTEIMEAIKYG